MSIRTEVDEVETLVNDSLNTSKELLKELNELNDNNDVLDISYIISLADSIVTLNQDASEKLY